METLTEKIKKFLNISYGYGSGNGSGYGDEAYFDMGYMEMPARDVYDTACAIIKWLCEKYCIVEREKVVEEDYKLRHGIFPDDMETTMYIKGREDILKDLFGTSIFNQNEE